MTTTSTPESIIRELHIWLHRTGMNFCDQHSFIEAYCSKLQELELPVDRFFCGAVVLHPLIGARAWKWLASDGTGIITDSSFGREELHAREEKSRGEMEHFKDDDIDDSLRQTRLQGLPPLQQLSLGAPFVRVKPTDEILPPDCDWIMQDNYTDLFGLPSPNTGDGKLEGGFTWSTRLPGGFTANHIFILQETVLSFSSVLRYHLLQGNARGLLKIYLGEDAGNRVFNGQIERNVSLVVRSVIWFSDIRGFTAMSNELDRTEIVDVLNGVFDITAGVIRQYKGQTLKFMGDGLMAIFSSATQSFQRSSLTREEKRSLDEQEAAQLCRNARMAATEVQRRLAELRKKRQEQGLRGASVGIGLHYGDVSYGNVGAEERLDFTVLGPVVNLASRTESLCSKLGAQVLCTQDFVTLDEDPNVWESRGEHIVKGVAHPVHVFELAAISSSEKEYTQSSTESLASSSMHST